jgi:integrase
VRVKYLKQRYKVYWFIRRPPKKLHKLLGSALVQTNLNTSDLATAFRRRDAINMQWKALSKTQNGPDAYTERLSLITREDDLSNKDRFVNERLTDDLSDARVETQAQAQVAISGFSEADQAAFWAWRKATKNEAPPEEFQYSIRQALAAVIPHKKGTVTDVHLDKYTLSVDLFLGGIDDRSLESIKRGEVIRWLDTLDKSNSTKSTYLSCLKGVFLYAQDREFINDQIRNPFQDIDLGKSDAVHYKFMEDDMLREIISKLTLNKHPHDGLIANLGRSTGVRQGELFNSKLETHKGIVCLNVVDAKTPAGIRLVPIPDRLVEAVTEAHPAWVAKGKGSDFSKRFGKAKRSVIDDRALTFHSLRVTFITWAGNTEDRWSEQHVAWLVGHEEGKGDAMTGQLYFKGYNLELMKQIVESVYAFDPLKGL